MAGNTVKEARTIIAPLLAAALSCAVAPLAGAAQLRLAALDGAPRPGLGDIEQFPIAPRDATPAQPIIVQPAPAQAQIGNPLWAVPLRTLSTTRERPIFSPTRRPPPAAIAVAPAEPVRQVPPPVIAETPSLALVGTIIGEGESIALFYNSATKATIRLRLGDTDETGWKLVAVDARTTLLEKGRQSVTLALPAPDEVSGVPRVGGVGIPRAADSDL
jgi:general secretion pathway protein N